MFDFITHLDLFPTLPWWLKLIVLALAAYAVYRYRKFFFRILTLQKTRQRWNALATKTDVNNAKKATGDNVVAALTEGFVERLPGLLSKDFTKQVRADVVKQLPELLSDRLVDRVLAALPEAMEQRAQKTIANLTAQVNALRKQVKGDDSWVPLGVHVRGFKLSEDDKDEYFALVEYNFQAGGVRALQNTARRLLVPKSKLNYSTNPFYHCQRMATYLGAPWYGKVNGDPKSIVMCGEAYTLFQ
jgi:hypothetical protein